MTGIAALAAAAAATSKITSATTGTTSNVTAVASGGQTIKVVQASPGSVIAGKPIQGGQTAIIGGQTVRLASPGGTTLLKVCFFQKSKISLVIPTTFQFSRQKLDA